MRILFGLGLVLFGFASKAFIAQYFHQQPTVEVQFHSSNISFSGIIQGDESWIPPTLNSSVFKLVKSNTSLTGKHYRYVQLINNKEIEGAFIIVHTDHNQHPFLIQHRLCDRNFIVAPYQGDFDSYFVVNQTLIPVDKDISYSENALTFRHASSGRILFETHAKQSSKDTIVKAPVFLSNPILSAQQPYGVPFIDNNDSTNTALNDELFWVELPAENRNDTLFLHDTLFLFTELYLPQDPVPFTILGDSIQSDRSKPSFEYLNALYHLIQNRAYLHRIGFANLVKDTVYLDPRSSFLDNSYFSVGNDSIRRFEYGLGGIDDAEDGDVVVHEMGHYIIEQAAGWIPLLDSETAGMNEGNCDFFSKTYALTLSAFQKDKLYTWDGNFGSWQGVSMNTENNYNDLSNSLLKDREIWSKPLMCIYNSLGKETTDSLFLEHLYFYNASATMPQMARNLMRVDSMLFNGKHQFTIRKCMCEQKILSNSECIVSEEPVVKKPLAHGIEALNSYSFSLKTGDLVIQSDEIIERLTLVNVKGQMELKSSPRKLKTQISSSGLASGLYILIAKTANQNRTFKLVVF
jgi:hypothetical protein